MVIHICKCRLGILLEYRFHKPCLRCPSLYSSQRRDCSDSPQSDGFEKPAPPSAPSLEDRFSDSFRPMSAWSISQVSSMKVQKWFEAKPVVIVHQAVKLTIISINAKWDRRHSTDKCMVEDRHADLTTGRINEEGLVDVRQLCI
jgi:hypothetical protein